MEEEYIIELSGITMSMSISFFQKISIIKHDTIGDTHFIRIDGKYATTFSIHNNTWIRVQQDLRDKK